MVSILIVTYNSAEYIKASIESFFEIRGDFEILIVDNHSKDDTVAIINHIIRTNPSYRIKLLCNDINHGFAKAMNQAYEVSSGDYILTFNPDAKVFPDTLSKAVAFLETNPKVGKVGLTDLDDQENKMIPLHHFSKYNTPQIIKTLNSKTDLKNMVPKEPFPVDWLFGTGFLIRRSAVNDSKLYAESTFLFWEEYWLSKKIKENGFEIYITPDIYIHHQGGTTFKFDKTKMFYARWVSFANEWIVRKDHFGKANAQINNMLYILDNALLYGYVYLKGIFFRRDAARTYSLFDYRGKLLGAWKICWWSKPKLGEVNNIAKEFFNL